MLDHQAQELPVGYLFGSALWLSATLTIPSPSLAAVNFFLGLVGIVQLTRIGLAQGNAKPVADKIEEVKEEVKEVVKA